MTHSTSQLLPPSSLASDPHRSSDLRHHSTLRSTAQHLRDIQSCQINRLLRLAMPSPIIMIYCSCGARNANRFTNSYYLYKQLHFILLQMLFNLIYKYGERGARHRFRIQLYRSIVECCWMVCLFSMPALRSVRPRALFNVFQHRSTVCFVWKWNASRTRTGIGNQKELATRENESEIIRLLLLLLSLVFLLVLHSYIHNFRETAFAAFTTRIEMVCLFSLASVEKRPNEK